MNQVNKSRLILLLLLACAAAILPARGRNEQNAPVGASVQVAGRVRLVGGGPMPEFVITGTEKEWHISREEAHKVQDFQHRTITVEGIETVIAQRFANNTCAGERRELRNIRVISVN